jgi:hypothetical protein
VRIALVLIALVATSACTHRSPDGYPAPVWDTVRVQVGMANVSGVDTRTTEPRLATRTGRIAVRLTRPAENVPLAPDAFVNALGRWLGDHEREVRERMGERCAGREPCFEIVPWPSLREADQDSPQGSADQPGGVRAAGAGGPRTAIEGEPETGVPEAPLPAAPPEATPRRGRRRSAAPEPAPAPTEPTEPTPVAPEEVTLVDWIVTAEIHEYEPYSGTLALHVRARAPNSEEPALDGPIRAPDLATIAARIAGALLPGIEQIEVAREEPVYHSERRIVGIRRIPAQ